jgi:hypothetical protein
MTILWRFWIWLQNLFIPKNAQEVFNFLLMIVTGCLLVITWESQRAYVILMPSQVTDFVVGKLPAFHVSIKNIGVLPAYHASAQIWCVPFKNPDNVSVADLKAAEVKMKTTRTEMTVFKEIANLGEDCTFSPPVLNQATVDAFHGGEYRMFIWGIVNYQTLMLNRYTRFCVEFGGPSSTVIPSNFPTCPFYNDAN